jgi:tetratricopeptide (TPR) repeat protein/tRNA A-37 threonylcarbamoyl transferase component Bud32
MPNPLTENHLPKRDVSEPPAGQPKTGEYSGVDSTVESPPPLPSFESPGVPSGPRGRFTVLQPHAQGGLGQVLLARDEDLKRHVALKRIRPDRLDSPNARARFLNEAEITGQLEHPGIVPIYALGQDDDATPYYAMRFVEGRNLADAIAAYHQQPTPLAFNDLVQRYLSICRTVAYAHSKGVIHRDLKPANVMLGEYGETLVLDWGIARRLDTPATLRDDRVADAPRTIPAAADEEPRLTQAGQVMGTPAYMAPEQAAGRLDEVGTPADVYALGGILYTLLTGQPPYQGSAQSILDQLNQGPPPPPAQVGRDVPRALEAICLKAMSHAIPNRYAGAGELARDVEGWLADEPIQAWREPVGARVWRWVRRHQTLVAAAVALLVAAAVALAALAWVIDDGRQQTARQWQRAEDNLTQAKAAEALPRRQQDMAQKEAATARAVTSFLTDDLLSEAAPQNNPVGNKITVRELLDRAGHKMDSRFGLFPQPEVEATVRFTLGETYRQLGDYTQAEKHLRRAFALRKKALGMKDPHTLVALNNLALSVKLQRKMTEAEPLYREALEASTQALGAEHRTTLTLLNNLAQLLVELGRPGEAEPLMQRCLETRRRALGDYDNDTLVSMNNLGSYWHQQGKWAEAEPLYRRTLALRRELLTSDHPDTIITMRNLGSVLAAQSKLTEAEALLREAVEASRRVNGPNHSVTLLFTNDLAGTLADRGKREEAQTVLRKLVKTQRAVLPPGHRDLGLSLGTLARVLTDGKEAEPLAREALAILRKTVPPGHWLVSYYESVLGGCLSSQGRYAEAEPLLVDSYKKMAKAKGVTPPRLAEAHARLVRLYEAWGKPKKAAEWRATAPVAIK